MAESLPLDPRAGKKHNLSQSGMRGNRTERCYARHGSASAAFSESRVFRPEQPRSPSQNGTWEHAAGGHLRISDPVYPASNVELPRMIQYPPAGEGHTDRATNM